MKNRLSLSLPKHETLKQNESSERRMELRRIERLERVLSEKMTRLALGLPSRAA